VLGFSKNVLIIHSNYGWITKYWHIIQVGLEEEDGVLGTPITYYFILILPVVFELDRLVEIGLELVRLAGIVLELVRLVGRLH
jgi:hypothetical protein